MEYEDLTKLDKLVHNVWDAVALFCLENHALRYTDLGRQMALRSGQHLSESELTRARHRLVQRKLIELTLNRDGHRVYRITAAGRVRLRQIKAVIRIVPDLDNVEDDPDDGEIASDDAA